MMADKIRTFQKPLSVIFSLLLIFACIGFVTTFSAALETPDYEVKISGGPDTKARIGEVVLDDPAGLAAILDITVSVDGKTVFSGKGASLPNPLTDWFAMGSGNRHMITVTMEMPKSAGNEYQGAAFNMQWNFISQSGEQTQIDTPNGEIYWNPNINPGDTMTFRILFYGGGSVGGASSANVSTGTKIGSGPLVFFISLFAVSALLRVMLMFPAFDKKKTRENPA